jgi:hypothetical protein
LPSNFVEPNNFNLINSDFKDFSFTNQFSNNYYINSILNENHNSINNRANMTVSPFSPGSAKKNPSFDYLNNFFNMMGSFQNRIDSKQSY